MAAKRFHPPGIPMRSIKERHLFSTVQHEFQIRNIGTLVSSNVMQLPSPVGLKRSAIIKPQPPMATSNEI
jgi:hypothetical protein